LGRVDTSELATGGHSGGGSLNFDGGTNRSNVKAVIGQHAAAIPLMHRPTDEAKGKSAGHDALLQLQLFATVDY